VEAGHDSRNQPEKPGGLPVQARTGRQQNGSHPGDNGIHPSSQRSRAKTAEKQPTLFDFAPANPAADEPAPHDATCPPAVAVAPVADPPHPVAHAELIRRSASITLASGEKAKA